VPGWLAGDVVFVSDEDVLDPETPATWRQRVPVVVLTRGRGGCTVWDRAGRHDLPAFDRGEVDPTGAGDVFATAFLVRYRECANAVESARFASAAAALAVARPRLEGIAGRAQIESLLATSRMAVER
jgi:sugar/nucleoside kinase (ribokinase family)